MCEICAKIFTCSSAFTQHTWIWMKTWQEYNVIYVKKNGWRIGIFFECISKSMENDIKMHSLWENHIECNFVKVSYCNSSCNTQTSMRCLWKIILPCDITQGIYLLFHSVLIAFINYFVFFIGTHGWITIQLFLLLENIQK